MVGFTSFQCMNVSPPLTPTSSLSCPEINGKRGLSPSSPSSWSDSNLSASVEDCGNAYEEKELPPLQRHRDRFPDQEFQFLSEELPYTYRKVLRSQDEPCSPCSCHLLQAYSSAFDLQDESVEEQRPPQLLSRDPYICLPCWHAFRQGHLDRMLQGVEMKRTYYDFQDRLLLTVTLEPESP